ncbi:SMP-30/gluconolactonase/LRE family protein [Novosphingobium sp. 9]|uniref:SMP-30/gluconolactonase/LRE family protein n=1 Tax=Novosphingobium sp. 9 TaxID=2025349 RepID=UPI0021B4F509|nr:SMP-30/gluconolactonase/LRE family protein [Novosphingobium sp. 9]
MELGEGPVWIEDALWFVDIKRQTVFRLDPVSGGLEDWAAPEHIGWVLPSTGEGLIAGLKSGPHRFRPEARSFEPIGKIDVDLPDNRLNDAATDPEGRLWFGTMDNLEGGETGRVYVLDKGEVRESGITPVAITNGPAISPCGTWLYHVDTLGKQVIRHTVNETGNIGEGTVFLDFNGQDRADWGWPDGATCDAEGGVWLGFYGGWAARRFNADGALTDEVRLPVANVTKVALGGAERRTAYATTARQGLSDAELAAQPLAGDLFTFPVAIPGLPVTPANT